MQLTGFAYQLATVLQGKVEATAAAFCCTSWPGDSGSGSAIRPLWIRANALLSQWHAPGTIGF